MANQTPTEEKMHYESLMGLFKYALTFFSVIAIVITFLIGNNLTEIKKTISDDIRESSKKLDSLVTDADKKHAEVKADADKTVAETKANAKEVLQYTKDLTTMQINLLKEDAKNLALSSARNKIEEAFKNNNIQTWIDQTARKEINSKLNEVINEETYKIQDVFNDFPVIYGSFTQIGLGSRRNLDILDSLSNYSSNDITRKLSKKLLLQKGVDYDNALIGKYVDKEEIQTIFFGGHGGLDIDTTLIGLSKRFSISETATNNDELINKLIIEIKTEPNLFNLAFYYNYLRKITNIKFNTFDSKPLFNHYSKYKQAKNQ